MEKEALIESVKKLDSSLRFVGLINSKGHLEAGGMIDGPSHSQGGVPINAEGGEAVMTKGAVTVFAPLLSLMNKLL